MIWLQVDDNNKNNDRDEMINHLRECGKLAPTDFKTRHDSGGGGNGGW